MNNIKLILASLVITVVSCNKKVEQTPATAPAVKEVKSGIETKAITAADLPKDLAFEGTFIEGYAVQDADGEHLVFLTETGQIPSKKNVQQEDEKDAKIFVYNYVLDKTNNYTLYWKIQDFVTNCAFDLYLNFIKDTFKITDLNQDGQAEIWTMYQKTCISDVSPFEMKIIMYQGKQKYALRGNSLIDTGKEKIGGEYQMDEFFTKSPKEFQDYALKLWKENNAPKYD